VRNNARRSLENLDYRVECDDFLLYELGRLIEEDRAAFEDEEFRRVVESGIHEHVERRLDVRAEIARRLRANAAKSARLLHAVEDIESPLRELPEIIESYTAYLFRRLEECADAAPDETITNAADTLFDSPDDRASCEAALQILASRRSAVSARVLAHVVSEPMLEEDLELKAYRYLQTLWPLGRHYILYSLKPHSHEDLPFRWFQLLVDCDEPSAVDRILEEFLVHGNDARYREDMVVLLQLLQQSRDPATEDKILQVLNSEDTPRPVVELLEDFLKTTKAAKLDTKEGGPWGSLDRIYAANEKYLAAAKLADTGRRAEALRALDDLLKEEPQYPFALMLRSLI
jgi:hypothetical protein